MLQVTGTYYNGKVHLENIIPTEHPIKVIVVFEEDIDLSESKRLKYSDFSFEKSRDILKDTIGSLSEAVIEERRDS
jgi:hypothetical protein